jgi:hypothetical protein
MAGINDKIMALYSPYKVHSPSSLKLEGQRRSNGKDKDNQMYKNRPFALGRL